MIGVWSIQPILSWRGFCGVEGREDGRAGGLIQKSGLPKKKGSETRFAIKITPINTEVVHLRYSCGMRSGFRMGSCCFVLVPLDASSDFLASRTKLHHS